MKAKRGVICPLVVLAALLAVVAVMAQWDTARGAGKFDPTASWEVHTAEHGAQCDNAVDDDNDGFINDGCPFAGVTAAFPLGKAELQDQCADALDDDSDGKVNDGCPAMGPSAAGDNGDVVTFFEIPKGDYNYDKVTISFSPAEFVTSKDVPLGAWAANLDAVSTLGLMNNPCTTRTPVLFNMFYATLDMSNTVTFTDSYGDLDSNGVLDGVEKYPDFLKTYFPGLTPEMRLFGTAQVGGTPVTMNMVFFKPGTTLLGQAYDADLGVASAQVLNNPMAMLAPNAITDNCSPLTAITTLFGLTWDNAGTAADEGGKVFMTNPTTAGDYTFTMWAKNRLDADADGIESYKDTCPYAVNEGDPLVSGSGDNDKDGIDNVCDSTPDENVGNGDPDGDFYANRGDLCPEVANADQKDTDSDDIGDVCDKNPTTVDGEVIERWLPSTVTISGGAAPAATATTAPAATATTAPAATATTAPAATPTTAPAATPTTAPTPKPTPTVAPTPKPTPTVVAPKPTPTTVAPPSPVPSTGGAGLLGSDGGFPAWAMYIIAVAVALMLGSIGMAATVAWRRRQ